MLVAVPGGATPAAVLLAPAPPPGHVGAGIGPPERVASVAVVRADGALEASWPAVVGADRYHVTYTHDGGASWSLAALNHPAGPNTDPGTSIVSITVSGVDNAFTYIVGVRARGAGGDSGWRNSPPAGPYVPPPPASPPSLPPTLPPAVPAGLTAAAGDGSVTLSWADPSDPGVTGYEYRLRYAGVAWSQWTAVPGSGSSTTSHTVGGLDNGTEYRFKLRAVNADGPSRAAPAISPWYAAAVPQHPAPPPTVPPPPPSASPPSASPPSALPPAVPAGLTAAAGDGSVTLSWADPSDPGVTGYEYRLRYAGVAWSQWAAVPGSGSSTTSHTVGGLDNGTEYRFKLRAVNADGPSRAAPAAAPWYAAAVPQTPPSLTVVNPVPQVAALTLGNHSGQWYYQAQGQIPPGGSGASGSAASAGVGGAGGASGSAGVGGAGGASGSAASAGASGAGAGAASASGASTCLGPVEGGEAQITGLDPDTVYSFGAYSDGGCTAQIASAGSLSSVDRPGYPFEQYHGRTDGALPVLWRESATSGVVYDVVYSSDGGVSWTRAATGISGTRCTSAQAGGHNHTNSVCYTITGPVGGSGNRMDNTASYIVAVRAVKSGHSSWWRNSNRLDPLPEPRVTAYPMACPNTTDYVLFMSWAKLPEAGVTQKVRYKIGDGAWVDLPAEDSDTPDHRRIQGSGTSQWLEWMDQLPAANSSYEVTAQVRQTRTIGTDTVHTTWGGRTFKAGTSGDVKRWMTRCPAAPTGLGKTLATSSTITAAWNPVTGPHDYDIRYKARGSTAWTAAAIGHSAAFYTITGLTPLQQYSIEVRARMWDTSAASGWSPLTASTGGVSVGNLSETTHASTLAVGAVSGTNTRVANSFSTKDTSSSLHSITADFAAKTGSPASIVAELYGSVSSSGSVKPASVAAAVLSGSDPASAGTHTWTCSTGCALTADSTYFVVLRVPSASGTANYTWRATASDAQTATPSTAGWEIADAALQSTDGTTWSAQGSSLAGRFKVTAAEAVGLAASGVTATEATLTLHGYHNGTWYYKRTAGTPADTACRRVASAATADIDELSGNTAYTYAAYTDSQCTDLLAPAESFTTPAYGSSHTTRNISQDTANSDARGVWSNGTTIWVTDGSNDKLYAYTLATGARDTAKEFNLASGNGDPAGVWSNGTTVWVAEGRGTKVYAYTLNGGARTTSKEFDLNSANSAARGIWSDGTTIWVADAVDDKVYAYTLATGTRVTDREFDLSSANADPGGIWSDGTTIWVTDRTDKKLYAYTLATGARVTSEEFGLSSANSYPWGMWSNGTTTWVTNSSDNKLYAYHARPPTKRLLVTDIATTSATLNLTWHTKAWYYKSATTGQTTCTKVAADTSTVDLSRPHPRRRVHLHRPQRRHLHRHRQTGDGDGVHHPRPQRIAHPSQKREADHRRTQRPLVV